MNTSNKLTHLSPGIIGGRCTSPLGKTGIHGSGIQRSLIFRVDDRWNTMGWYPWPVLYSSASAVTLGFQWCHHGVLADIRATFFISFLDGRGRQWREFHYIDIDLSRYSKLQFRTKRFLS